MIDFDKGRRRFVNAAGMVVRGAYTCRDEPSNCSGR
jgi:hypothetical protein